MYNYSKNINIMHIRKTGLGNGQKTTGCKGATIYNKKAAEQSDIMQRAIKVVNWTYLEMMGKMNWLANYQ